MSDDVRARLSAAMGYAGDDWLERAVEQLDALRRERDKRKIYDTSTVGLRILCAREALGMSQGQLAIRLGVHRLRVCGWEKGREDIPAAKVGPLAAVLRVRKAWLTMESEEGGPEGVRTEPVKELNPRWRAWQKEKAAWAKAQEEARRRNAARQERKAAEALAGGRQDR